MHHLQSGKWTRTQMTAREKQPYLATCRNVRKQLLKWEDMGRGRDLVCSLCSCVILRVILKPPLSIQPHEILPMHCTVSPFSCLNHPSPYSLPRLLLTLVCPNKPFMLKQFRTLKERKTSIMDLYPLRPHTDSRCIYSGLTKDMLCTSRQRQTGTFENN